VFFSSKNISVKSLKSLKYRIGSSANRVNLTFSFSVYILFISFSCLFPPAKNSGTILNKSEKNEYLCIQFYLMYYGIRDRFIIYSPYSVEVCSFYA
jgi:hypothetical protein